MKYFSSDWHLGHEGSLKFSDRPFASVREMDREIIYRMTAPLKKGDDFYFAGDLAWEIASAQMFFDALPRKVKFYWVLGNHDRKGMIERFAERCAFVGNMLEIKLSVSPDIPRQSITLCHYPMLTWNKSHYNAWQLFGHHHISSWKCEEIPYRTPGKQLNVNCEFFDYNPVNELSLIELMNARPDNWDFIPKPTS